MGSGFNFFTNAYDVTPTTTGAWVDVDVSAYIPAGSTGVILKLTASAQGNVGVRKNGSTDDFGLLLSANHGRFALVGVDENRIFEAYIGSTGIKIYLVGYCDLAVGFFTNAVNKTPSTTGSWVDVDASADIPSDATGVICLLFDSSTSTEYWGGIRKNGSTDEYTYGRLYVSGRFFYQLCGVDANRIFEAKIQNTAVKVYLVGYTKSPITFFTNGINKSLTSANVWTDIDVTSDTEATADGAIIFMVDTSTSTNCRGDVRKNGSSDNHTNMVMSWGACAIGLCGMDSNQIFEGYIDNVAVKFYLIGYCKPAAAGQVYEITVDAIVQASDIPNYETNFNIFKDAAVSSQSLHAPETTFNISQNAVTQALATAVIEIVAGVIEIFKDAIATAQATSAYEVTFTIPLNAIVKAEALSTLESTLNISPTATVKVQAEVAIIKEGEIKITKLFLILGDLAIQIQGD